MSVFLLLSLGLHLLLLQFDVSRKAVQQVVQRQSVGYVSRPIVQFFPARASRRIDVPELSPSIRSKHSSVKPPRTAVPQVLPSPPKAGKEKTLARIAPAAEKIAVSVVDRPVPLVAVPVVWRTEPSLQAGTDATVVAVQQAPTKARAQNQSAVSQLVETASPKSVSGERSTIFQQALPRYDLNPLPRYPEIDRRRGRQGTVELEVLVLADGRVGETRLVASSGYKSLDRAAQKSVRHWHFKPATSAGMPVASRVVIPVDFVLDGE